MGVDRLDWPEHALTARHHVSRETAIAIVLDMDRVDRCAIDPFHVERLPWACGS